MEGIEEIPHGQAKLASMLAEGHDILRECLERVDFYTVRPCVRVCVCVPLPFSLPPSFLGLRAPCPLQNKLDDMQHALDTLKDKTDLHPHGL